MMKQEQRYIIDRIGEETNLEECSLCFTSSCFSCVSDHCTALKMLSDGGCVYFKDCDENYKEIWRCFYRLIRFRRFDLLTKYADTLAALGLMDYEIDMAKKERKRLEKHRKKHLKKLMDQNWKDGLVVVYLKNEEDEPDDEAESAESGTDPVIPESVFDNSMDAVESPTDMTDTAIDDETAEEIQTRDHFLCEEIKDENFRMYEILHEVNERIVMETGEDDLPEDYGEQDDDDLPVDENGNLLSFDEYTEHEQEKEAEEEKCARQAQEDRDLSDDGEDGNVSILLNYFYKTIGFPVRRKQPIDPVVLAYGNLGASIVYQAAEDYIVTLRMLWSGEYHGRIRRRLIVKKWQLETFIGSRFYWLCTNISPERILDQCWKSAKEQAVNKIERINERITAGIEDGEINDLL